MIEMIVSLDCGRPTSVPIKKTYCNSVENLIPPRTTLWQYLSKHPLFPSVPYFLCCKSNDIMTATAAHFKLQLQHCWEFLVSEFIANATSQQLINCIRPEPWVWGIAGTWKIFESCFVLRNICRRLVLATIHATELVITSFVSIVHSDQGYQVPVFSALVPGQPIKQPFTFLHSSALPRPSQTCTFISRLTQHRNWNILR